MSPRMSAEGGYFEPVRHHWVTLPNGAFNILLVEHFTLGTTFSKLTQDTLTVQQQCSNCTSRGSEQKRTQIVYNLIISRSGWFFLRAWKWRPLADVCGRHSWTFDRNNNKNIATSLAERLRHTFWHDNWRLSISRWQEFWRRRSLNRVDEIFRNVAKCWWNVDENKQHTGERQASNLSFPNTDFNIEIPNQYVRFEMKVPEDYG